MGHDSQLQSHIEGVCFTTYKCLIRHNERLLQFMPLLSFSANRSCSSKTCSSTKSLQLRSDTARAVTPDKILQPGHLASAEVPEPDNLLS